MYVRAFVERSAGTKDGVQYHLYGSESIVPRIDEAKAIRVITAQAASPSS